MTGVRFEWLAEALRERLATGDIGAGGALESEAALGRRYGVSRVTVRRALETLRGEGLLASRPGAGWFVAGATSRRPVALGSFRPAPAAAASGGHKAVEYGFRVAPPDVLGQLELPEGAEVLRVSLVRSVEDGPLAVTTEWVPAELAAPVSRAECEQWGTWESLRRHGARVAAVRQSVTATVANPAVAALLDLRPGAPLLLVRRLALGVDDRPLALADHRYPGQRFRVDVDFRGGPADTSGPPGLTPVEPPAE